jgi:phosphoribosylaminoimidazole (AIR) synthetase
MREVFNLGVGMVAVLPPAAVAAAQAAAAAAEVPTWVLGAVRTGGGRVLFVE